MKTILASSSQRRKEIFDKINLDYIIIGSEIDEKKLKISKSQPHLYSMKVAYQKGLAVSKRFPHDVIISADTIVVYKKIFEKPKNYSEGVKFLKTLSNKTHYVYTGVSIICNKKNVNINFYEKTSVTFNKLLINDIKYYIKNYNPYDKSGSYGIQDWSCLFVKEIKGCFYNVIGFPISKFYKVINENNIKLTFHE